MNSTGAPGQAVLVYHNKKPRSNTSENLRHRHMNSSRFAPILTDAQILIRRNLFGDRNPITGSRLT